MQQKGCVRLPMPIHPDKNGHELPSGTLELLILRSVTGQARHGYDISRDIKVRSAGTLLVEEGSLYPALHRLVRLRQLRAAWGISENNRKARFYSITNVGKKRLAEDSERWRSVSTAVTAALAANAVALPVGGVS